MSIPRLTRRSLALLGAIPVLLLAGCGEIASGELVTEDRSVEAFDSIDVRDGANVDLIVDSGAEPSVSVTYDDNLLDNVVTRVSGGTLVVEFSGAITMLGGTGRVVSVVVDSIDEIAVSGGADLSASGSIDHYTLDASGGANVSLSDLEAGTVEVQVSGGADAVVRASESVEGDASGGANLRIVGSPRTVAVDSSGGADVEVDS